ncbi:MAG TPA: hypothetical protein VHQ98_05685 [Gaiellaceae bacterium]|nr:hypothetical protein [Gaiellaceae bacterium]
MARSTKAMAKPWSAELELKGAGGEPVDLWRTLASHGVADLLPQVVDEEAHALVTTLPLSRGRARTIHIRAGRKGFARIEGDGITVADGVSLVETARHMLRLDSDLSGFYAAARGDPDLGWACAGAGRMLRSPTVFEDVVKTICTTNCTWSATVRMVTALVQTLGVPAEGAPERRTFPTPEAMAQAGDDFYVGVAKTGYRGAYLRTLAADVAEGRLDLEALDDPELPDDEAAERLLALPGVGPYACAHVMMLLGRYGRLVLDSWTRPKYRKVTGRPRVTDKGIEKAFRRYREYAGLAFWLVLTRDWVTEAG